MKKSIFLTIALMVMLSACTTGPTTVEEGKPIQAAIKCEDELVYISAEQVDACLKKYNMDRTLHSDGTRAINPKVFENLPEFPKDFYEVLLLYERGRLLSDFSFEYEDENYYMQPEWAPENIFEQSCVKTYLYPPEGYFGAFGFGAFPGHTIVDSAEPGQDLRFITHIRTSCGISKYQGIYLKERFSNYVELRQRGTILKSVDQNPEEVKNYFKILNITPELFLLEPNFPVYEAGWARRVVIEVHVNEDTPDGEYAIEFVTVDVPKEYDTQWTKRYRLKYAGSATQVAGAPYTVFIKVKG